jgi:hypothetical protein
MFKPLVAAMLSVSIGLNIYLIRKTVYIENLLSAILANQEEQKKEKEIDRLCYILSPLPSLPCSPLMSYNIETISIEDSDFEI